jgi:hypothetical protein
MSTSVDANTPASSVRRMECVKIASCNIERRNPGGGVGVAVRNRTKTGSY